MKLEFQQLDRRYEHLRVRNPERRRRLLASLAASGQQTPIVVVAVCDQPMISGSKWRPPKRAGLLCFIHLRDTPSAVLQHFRSAYKSP